MVKDDLYFMRAAYNVAIVHSTDPSTQNGAIIVDPLYRRMLSQGANHFPAHVVESLDRWERPIKYSYVEHAERNAIYAAAKIGVGLDGATMYCPWAACADCARALIQSGIRRLVTHKMMADATPSHWKESINIAWKMLCEAGVIHDELIIPITDIQIRFNGVMWTPDGRHNA
jgi:dCMP deaminase